MCLLCNCTATVGVKMTYYVSPYVSLVLNESSRAALLSSSPQCTKMMGLFSYLLLRCNMAVSETAPGPLSPRLHPRLRRRLRVREEPSNTAGGVPTTIKIGNPHRAHRRSLDRRSFAVEIAWIPPGWAPRLLLSPRRARF